MEVRKLEGEAIHEEDYLHAYYQVEDGNQVLAAAAIYLNKFHVFEGRPIASFGTFKCEENYQAFTLLMKELIKEVKLLGYDMLIGPIDGSTWNAYRIVTTAQEDPFFLELETPLFYKDFFQMYGFETFAKYISTKATSIVSNWVRNEGRWKSFVKMGVVFEQFNLSRSDEIFRNLAALCNRAFKKNFLFSPINAEDFLAKMKPLKAHINPRYTYLARYQNEIVGFIFCYQDIYNKLEKSIVVKTLAREPGTKFQGLGSVLSSLVMKNAKEDGFTKGIHALMDVFNSSTYLSHKFRSEPFREYELLSYRIKD